MNFYLVVFCYVTKNIERLEFEEMLGSLNTRDLNTTDLKNYDDKLLILKDKLNASKVVNVSQNTVVFADDKETAKNLVLTEIQKIVDFSHITDVKVFDYTHEALEFAKQKNS